MNVQSRKKAEQKTLADLNLWTGKIFPPFLAQSKEGGGKGTWPVTVLSKDPNGRRLIR